ncbi:PAS domain S-box protein [Deinococcus roseus]|uniref:histidine kinase n=1 Tax=Deinococcus roseus TaxID=392414 RepID=A0ABQ2CZV2_9DEIO|nr:PAS domain S-box protein [Deinococcus roseus]GGJ33500.1 hypothetical protein GCM10008938_19700 [Deinococcus roseus]
MTLNGLQANSTLTHALNLLPHPAWVQDRNGCQQFNSAWMLFFGGVPVHWTEVLHPHDREKAALLQEGAWEQAEGFHMKVRAQSTTAGEKTCQLSFQPISGLLDTWMGLLVELETPVPEAPEFQQALHDLRVGLASSLKQQDVVTVIVRQMQQAFQAAECQLLFCEKQGTLWQLRQIQDGTLRTLEPEVQQGLQEGKILLQKQKSHTLLEVNAHTLPDPQTLEPALLLVPLRMEDQWVGVMELHFPEGFQMSEERYCGLVMHTGYLALVLRRTRLFEAEKRARTSSEAALKHSQVLQQLTSALFRTDTPVQMMQEVLDHARMPLGIQQTALFLMDALPADQNPHLELVAWQGQGSEVALIGKRCTLEAGSPAVRAARERKPLYLGTPEEARALFPGTMQQPAHTHLSAKVYLPLLLGEQLLGVLLVGFADSMAFQEAHQVFLDGLSTQVAQAVERLRYHAKEKRLIEEREETIARLNAILDNAPIGIGMFDENRKFETVNPRLAEYNQLAVQDQLGKTLADLYPGSADHLMAAQHYVLLSGRPVLNIEETRATVTGPVQNHLISYFPVKTHDGRTLGVGTTLQNITERKQTEEALRASEHFLKHINDTVPALVYVFSLRQNRITYINPSFTQVTGYTLRDLQQMGSDALAQMIHPEDQPMAVQEAQKLLTIKDGEVISTEYRTRHKDGHWLWLHSTQAVFARGPDGTPSLLLGAGLDITERKEAEMAVRESEQRFQMVANQAPVMVWMGSDAFGGTFFNTSWLNFRGRTLEEELGEGWLEGIHPEDLAVCDSVFREAHDTVSEFQLEYRLKRHDGQYRWVVDRGIPRLTENGEFRGFIGACIEIHDRKMAETVLQDSEKRLRELMDAQKRFIADAAHELRTPLTAIQGNLDILIRYPHIPEDEKKDIIQDVQREATRLGRLVHDMLQLARGDSGATMREAEVDFSKLLMDTWRETERVFTSHRFVLEEVQKVHLFGDADRLKQVMLILLENALKYTPKGGEVRLSLQHQGTHALLKIADTGMGISEEDLPRVFERFYRADKSRHRSPDPGGTGLGLPIARWIVEAHEGHIWIESQVDQGTEVHVQLPIRTEE